MFRSSTTAAFVVAFTWYHTGECLLDNEAKFSSLLQSIDPASRNSSVRSTLKAEYTPVVGFIGRQGSRLIDLSPGGDSDATWRFAGMNMYWLGLDENCAPPQVGRCIAYPSHFRIDDALETAAALGANVIRAHSLGISTGSPLSLQQFAGSNDFNDDALETVDYALHRAKALGIRFIIPLTDNYNYYHGGYYNFVDYQISLNESAPAQPNLTDCDPFPKRIVALNDSCRAFFDHNASATFGIGDATISGFKKYIKNLLNHKNRYSGNLLKYEPTILAWETGNELQIKSSPFTNWTNEIAAFVKQTLGAKQLVMDGRDEVGNGIDQEALQVNLLDRFSHPTVCCI